MTIILISWIGVSLVLCLALLRIVARQVPTLQEQMTTGNEPELEPENAVATAEPTIPSAPIWAEIASTPPDAEPAESIPLLLPDIDMVPEEAPLSR